MGNQSPPFTSRQILRESLSSSHLTSQLSCRLLLLLQFLLLRTMLHGMEYSFGQFRSSVVPASPPNLLPTPGLLTDREAGVMIDRVGGKCLYTMQALFSNSQDIGGVLPANPNHSIVWAAVKSVSSIPVR